MRVGRFHALPYKLIGPHLAWSEVPKWHDRFALSRAGAGQGLEGGPSDLGEGVGSSGALLPPQGKEQPPPRAL